MIRWGGDRWIGVLAPAAMLLSLAQPAADMTWLWFGYSGARFAPAGTDMAGGASPSERSERPAQDGAQTAIDLDTIEALAPFGSPARPAPPATPPSAQPAPAALTAGLTLRGVIQATPPSASRALIQDAKAAAARDRVTRAYGIGDSIRPGLALRSIAGDHVTVGADTQAAILKLVKPGKRPRMTGSLDRLRSQIPASRRGAVPPARNASPDAIIDHYRKRIARNPQAVLEGFDVSVTPQGYRIGDTPPADVARAGLRPGDVIAEVNGIRVGNVEADRKHFETVAAAGEARVVLLRNGRRVVLSFPLR